MVCISPKDYLDEESMNEFLNNFYAPILVHGYDISLSKKVSFNWAKSIILFKIFEKHLQPYLKSLMNELRDFIFANATTALERIDRRIIMDSDLVFVYFVEKWVQRHVAISQKNTFYHE